MTKLEVSRRMWPRRGSLGLLLVGTFWVLNWGLSGTRTQWGFFPLWLGYCLVVDAWAWHRTGTSLWARDRRRFAGLFLASVPMWWLFELINLRTANWYYLGRSEFTDVEYVLLASLSFSTVLPAVFGTAELLASCGWVRRIAPTRRLRVRGPWWLVSLLGLALLLSCLAWPRYFFPFVWLSLFLIVDPVNHRRGDPSILDQLSVGEWRGALALGAGGLTCGFFWEMWNMYSYPKWEYQIPFVDFLHVFEMPLLGYGGYIFFALELFALYHLACGWAWRRAGSVLDVPPEGRLSQPRLS